MSDFKRAGIADGSTVTTDKAADWRPGTGQMEPFQPDVGTGINIEDSRVSSAVEGESLRQVRAVDSDVF